MPQDRRKKLMEISYKICCKMTDIRQKVNQLHSGIFWADLDSEELDRLKEINTILNRLIERRRGTF